jgi:predicted lipid-binding transport protein (Tim44 family)
MNHFFDPLNLFILAIAVVVFFKLRSVLGRRTGNERPPIDYTVARRTDTRQPAETFGGANREPLPQAQDSQKPSEPIWQGYAPEGSALARGLESIAVADSTFSPKSFLEGAKLAYEMIVSAFAQGDKSSLKNLVSKEVFDGFASAIDAREKAGEKMEQRFVGFDSADIAGAEIAGKRASVTVKFISQMITATLNKAGEIIDGDLKQIREVTDIWTFERDVSSNNPNWRLVATDAAA